MMERAGQNKPVEVKADLGSSRLLNLFSRQHPAVQTVVRQVFSKRLANTLYRYGGADPIVKTDPLHRVDLLFAGPNDSCRPYDAFHALRWGGQVVFVGLVRNHVKAMEAMFEDTAVSGFRIDVPTTTIGTNPLPYNVPGVDRLCHFFVARKIYSYLEEEEHRQFTFDVFLAPNSHTRSGYVVRKQIPEFSRLINDVRRHFPDASEQELHRRTEHLHGKILPMILSREVQLLNRMRKLLPEKMVTRIPALAGLQKSDRGYVTALDMHWLRPAREPITWTRFIRQTAALVHAIHESAGIWHLDIRPENMIITSAGVSLLDFGSAVLAREDLNRSPILQGFYEDLMKTCEVQRALTHMINQQAVLCRQFKAIEGRVSGLMDSFSLVVLMTSRVRIPELAQVIDYEPESPEVQELRALAWRMLKPPSGEPEFNCDPGNILEQVEQVERKLLLNTGQQSKRNGSKQLDDSGVLEMLEKDDEEADFEI